MTHVPADAGAPQTPPRSPHPAAATILVVDDNDDARDPSTSSSPT